MIIKSKLNINLCIAIDIVISNFFFRDDYVNFYILGSHFYLLK